MNKHATSKWEARSFSTETGPSAPREHRSQQILKDLRVIYRAIQAHSKSVERRCQVSATMLRVLREIAKAGRMRISQVANTLAIHQSTASNLLDKLEQRGLVTRQRGGTDEDQRVVQVTLTNTGRELLTHPEVPESGPLSEALSRHSDEDLADLNHSLEKLVAALPAGELPREKELIDYVI
ncbi:MAG: MarR family transcriptional regulator [Desulfurivibrio sp.]|nr:MarR family transcriptional regulator [Desulfurivibrio sp.]